MITAERIDSELKRLRETGNNAILELNEVKARVTQLESHINAVRGAMSVLEAMRKECELPQS